MATQTDALFLEAWSKRVQRVRRKKLVAQIFANTEERANLKFGDKVHRPYITFNTVRVRNVVRLADRTVDSISATDEYLDIDQQKGLTFAMDHYDEIQASNYAPLKTYGAEVAFKLDQYIDGDIFNVARAAAFDYLDAGDVGGSAGTSITVATTNMFQIFTNAYATLRGNNVEDNGDFVAVVDPFFLSILSQTVMGKDLNTLSGAAIENGYKGRVANFDILESNNLPVTFSLGMATNPTEGDTVVIAGVTFTFNATPSGAGSVDIGANAAASVDNLVAAIMDTGTAGTTYIQLSSANRDKMDRFTATDNTTSIGFVGVGTGRVVLSETLTAAGDVWSDQTIHCIFGKKKSVDLVVQDKPAMELRDEPKQKTKNVLIDALYGRKVFDEGAQQLLNVRVKVV